MATLDTRPAHDYTPEREAGGPEATRRFGTWPLRASALALILSAYVALVGMGWILGSLVVAAEGTSFGELDRSVSEWFASRRTPLLDTLTDIGSGLSDTSTVVILLAVLATLFLVTWRRWPEALALIVAVGLEAAAFVTMAFLVGRERPPVEQLDPSPPTSSFPSGHTAAAVALYMALALIARWNTENRAIRVAAWTVALLAPVAVALSRLYRGMHFMTDVTAGALLGVACVAVAIRALRADGVVEPTAQEGEVVA